MAKKLIDLIGISKSYGDKVILDDLNLYLNENRFLTILGPSGCGKTTTLRILGGFETPDKGRVIFEGKDITMLPPNERQVNTVFQKYALFTHMNIEENHIRRVICDVHQQLLTICNFDEAVLLRIELFDHTF